MDFSHITEFIEKVIRQEKKVPGCDLRIMQNHKLLYHHISGAADFEGAKPFTGCFPLTGRLRRSGVPVNLPHPVYPSRLRLSSGLLFLRQCGYDMRRNVGERKSAWNL